MTDRELEALAVAYGRKGQKFLLAWDKDKLFVISLEKENRVIEIIDTQKLIMAFVRVVEGRDDYILNSQNIADIINNLLLDMKKSTFSPKLLISEANYDVMLFGNKMYLYPNKIEKEHIDDNIIFLELNTDLCLRIISYRNNHTISQTSKYDSQNSSLNNTALNYYRRGIMASQVAVIEYLAALCEENTGFPHALRDITPYIKGGGEIGSNRWRSAGRFFQMALEFEPDFPEAMIALGRSLVEQKQYPEAAALFAKATVLPPRLPVVAEDIPHKAKAYYEYGRVLEDFLQQEDEAILAYTRALEDALVLPDAALRLGRLLRKRGRRREAAPYLDHALSYKPFYEFIPPFEFIEA